jgi:Rrf2 family protein
MRLSARGDYAVLMMLDLARNETDEKPVSLGAIAERTGLSRGYLEQLALPLRTARLLRGISGRYGGYRLARPPGEISVGQIVEAVIGPLCIVACLEDPDGCARTSACECRLLFALINHRVSEELQRCTLSDLLDPVWIRSLRDALPRYKPARKDRRSGDPAA